MVDKPHRGIGKPKTVKLVLGAVFTARPSMFVQFVFCHKLPNDLAGLHAVGASNPSAPDGLSAGERTDQNLHVLHLMSPIVEKKKLLVTIDEIVKEEVLCRRQRQHGDWVVPLIENAIIEAFVIFNVVG